MENLPDRESRRTCPARLTLSMGVLVFRAPAIAYSACSEMQKRSRSKMLGTADPAHKRQIPGSSPTADRSALMAEGASGLFRAACPSPGQWDGGRKEEKTPERLRGSGGPARWQREHRLSPPAFLLLCEVRLLFPHVPCR